MLQMVALLKNTYTVISDQVKSQLDWNTNFETNGSKIVN